jgi:hypothetical protein
MAPTFPKVCQQRGVGATSSIISIASVLQLYMFIAWKSGCLQLVHWYLGPYRPTYLPNACAPAMCSPPHPRDFNIQRLVCLGGFRNTRTEFEWRAPGGATSGPPLVLELDETAFEHGTLYELECETSEPETAKAALEALLAARGIGYAYSATSKFGAAGVPAHGWMQAGHARFGGC